MTAKLEPAAPAPNRGSYVVRPRVETAVPGTPFAVWHDGPAAATISVLLDGALDLTGSTYWIVGLADTWQGSARPDVLGLDAPAKSEPPSDALVEDLAKGLCADWYRATINGWADDAETNAFWDKPLPTPTFPNPQMTLVSFRNRARAMIAGRTGR